MSSEKVIDSKLALIAIQRWKSDPVIRQRFVQASDFYDYLIAQDTRQKACEKWQVSAEIRRRYKTFTDYLASQFAAAAD